MQRKECEKKEFRLRTREKNFILVGLCAQYSSLEWYHKKAYEVEEIKE